MTIEEMKQRKKELGYTNIMISEKTGIAIGTVQKIFSGTTTAPRYDTIQKLEKLLSDTSVRGEVREYAVDYNAAAENVHKGKDLKEAYSETKDLEDADEGNRIKVSHLITLDKICDDRWKRQGEYTLEDYYSLPDDIRVELIDGVIYNLAAPSLTHQVITAQLWMQLFQCIKKHDMNCKVFISPVDVRLDMDEKTMVQPDVAVICQEIESDKRIEGAPELIVEVLSEATRKKDCTIKLEKYMNAGVREYWIIDPDNHSVWIYDFANDNYPQYYSFEDHIPVGISEGKCEIDFPEIKRNL